MSKDNDNLSHLKLLVNLAWVDGHISDLEKGYIMNISKAFNIDHNTVQNLLVNPPHNVEIPGEFTIEKRHDTLKSLVQLMRLDDRLYSAEVRYCISVAEKLGFERTYINDLLINLD